MSGLDWLEQIEAETDPRPSEIADKAMEAIDELIHDDYALDLHPHLHLQALHEIQNTIDHEIGILERRLHDPDEEPA